MSRRTDGHVSLQDLVDRCNAASIPAHFESVELDEGISRTSLAIDLPNGRRERRYLVDESDADALAAVAFEDLTFLGDYDAIVRRTSGEIEARVRGLGRVGQPFLRVPGLENLDDLPAELEAGDEDEPSFGRGRRPENWRIVVDDGVRRMEISPASKDFATLMEINGFGVNPITLKLSGFLSRDHDTALDVLDNSARALSIDFDLRYGAGFQLVQQRQPGRLTRVVRHSEPPEFPRNAYQSEPAELYMYGRSAMGLPLLQFLAYYQVLEYFFPIFSRRELLARLGAQLRDPRFDATSDDHLNRLVSLAEPASRFGSSEREQLRATVRAIADETLLAEYLESIPRVTEHFCSKKQAIGGVKPIQLGSGAPDLRDQISDRMYAIRCRIVHTKQDGGDAGVDLLLPTSREAASLRDDVDLIRRLAQWALVERAVPLRLPPRSV